MERWWQFTPEMIEKKLETSLKNGLSQKLAALLIAKYGPNQLKEAKKISPVMIFIGQFKDFIVWILIGAGVVSGFLQEWVDAMAIVAIVILNSVLGFIQEFRAEKSLQALKKLSAQNAKVIRDGNMAAIPASSLVPGDLIEIEAGDNIPADSRVVYATANFSTHEASLTGESTPVEKTSLALNEEDVPLADRANMVYMGTSVSNGKARAIVCDTGMKTELGKIAGMIEDIGQSQTPLQKKLEEFGKIIVYVCFVLVGLVFVMGILRGGKFFDMFLTAVSLAVAAIPEGLPAVVTIALALGVQRMVRRNALIRKLPAVETLGCATVICSDKTGTLTKNEMTVQAIYTNGRTYEVTGIGYEPKGQIRLDGKEVIISEHQDLRKTLTSGILCNSASLRVEESKYKIFGDPTEGAIIVCAEKAGLIKKDLEARYNFIEEIPFDSIRKKMTVIRGDSGKKVAFIKGAPEVILSSCINIDRNGNPCAISQADREAILKANDSFSNRAMRVLAVAYKTLDNETIEFDPEIVEKGITFLGLVAMIDPPREEVKLAMKECMSAGIKTVMITGDHKSTAIAIARQLGFFDEGSLALTGEELDKLSDDDFKKKVEKISVYARVSPEHKLRVVKFWRQKRHVVAMTGDGVNDAPAVKEADIGVAMGITGTDVTKEVSDMVVTDDNFASIVAAVEEGRGIYDNIKKFIHYLLSCNAGEILVMFLSSLVGLPVPLLPIHILWVNLVTDGFPALALGVDPVEKNIMSKPPRPTNEPVITRVRGTIMLIQGAFIAVSSLLAFLLVLYAENEGIERARTAAFLVLSTSQLFHAFNCRSMTESIFKIGFFTNMKLVYAALVSFSLLMAVVYTPFLAKVFKVQPLNLLDWVMVVAISSLSLWGMELVKLINKKTNFLKKCC